MSGTPSFPQSACRDTFLRHLEQPEVKRHNWENKIFYLPSDIRVWMNTTSPGQRNSNVVDLISSLYANEGHGFAKTSAVACTKHLLVLAVLLHPDVNCGHLIDVFVRCGLSDDRLSLPDPSSFYHLIVEDLGKELPRLPESLSESYSKDGYKTVTNAFDRVRWAFCPAPLELHMDIAFPFGPCILPFLHGKVVNEKGGTANVRHYKIQEDLVESQQLKDALEFSRHKDPNFGWCYEFAIKSYVAGWEDIYKLESEAFRGVRDHEGVVKYLGEYHFKGAGDNSPTHNIMLEYGEHDLDEYLAETYPPVLTTEIIAFWEDLFKVATTLQGLHHLEHKGEDGKKSYYRGWHGDIKPDNILRIRGKFKLADFGFTKFEKDEIGKTRTFLLGGTQTYGAPECDKQRSGTSTPHLQTIDTWSFGCVLSAVATWVVLGSQAYDNYRKVRKREITELRQRVKSGKGGSAPSGDDAFHDGTKVLPSVLHWHDYLRNSSRKADTITHRVLTLVQEKMLHENPNERPSFEQLCEDLKDIIVLAKNEHQVLVDKRQLKTIAQDTLEALLDLDKDAPAMATPIFQANSSPKTSQSVQQSNGSLLPNKQSQLQPRSERVRKSERLEKIVIGKTANRKGAIETDLGLGILNESQEEIYDSPQHSPALASAAPVNLASLANNNQYTPASKVAADIGAFPPAAVDNKLISKNDGRPMFKSLDPIANSVNASSSSSSSEPTQRAMAPLPKNIYTRNGKEVAVQSGYFTHEQELPSMAQNHNFRTPVTPPEIPRVPARQRTTGSTAHFPEAYELPSNDTTRNYLPPTPQMSPEPVSDPDGTKRSLGEFSPSSMIPGSFAIFDEHARLEKLWGDKKGLLSSLLGRIPDDPWLKKFIFNRDIVFVVDNAATMKPHWSVVATVLVTLAMKIGPLDTSGLDLFYTIGSNTSKYNLEGVKGWGIPKAFKASMQGAGEEINSLYKTNMKETLEVMFDRYTDTSKKMTLIVLTDGLWEGCVSRDDTQALIADFLSDLKVKLKKRQSRWFSIQFIYFGDDGWALARLQDLDDNMPTEEDVIDTKPWNYYDVSKLILGSIRDGDDKDDPISPPPIASSSMSRPPAREGAATPATLPAPPGPERKPSRRKRLVDKFVR